MAHEPDVSTLCFFLFPPVCHFALLFLGYNRMAPFSSLSMCGLRTIFLSLIALASLLPSLIHAE